jgi:ParB/RepB/Spo0J family partition protein
MSATVKLGAQEVPFNSIYNPEDENARSKLHNIPQLAESIKLEGLLQGLTVEPNQDPETNTKFPYRLRAGGRRHAALTLLRWGCKPVPVNVVSPEDGLIKNLVENIQREDLPTIDVAQRLHDMEAGEAPGCTKKYTKKELATRLGMSLSHVSNLIRAHKNLTSDAKKLWRKHNIPTTTVFAWSALEEADQEKATTKWVADQEKAAERAAAASEAGDTKKKPRKSRGEEPEASKALVKGKKATQLESYKAVLEWKLETGALKGAAEKEAAVRQIDTLRFMLGDLARFPAVSAADLKDHAKWCAEQVKAEEEAEKEAAE